MKEKKVTMSERFVDKLIANEKAHALESTKSLILHLLNDILDEEKAELFNAVKNKNHSKRLTQHFFCVQTEYIIHKIKTLSINF